MQTKTTALQDKARAARTVRVAIGDRLFIYNRLEGDAWRELVRVHQGISQTAQWRDESDTVVTTASVLARVGDNVWPAVQTWTS